jgi:hypothetical protein
LKASKRKIGLVVTIGLILTLFTHCDALVKKTASEIELVNVDGSSSNPSNSGGSTSSGGGNSGNSGVSAQAYFTNTVLPEINRRCVACHAPLFENPVIAAPLSIISYTAAKTLLLDGNAQDDNSFYNKVSNRSGHTGGNLCDGSSDGICELVKTWWIKETGSTNSAVTLSGEVLAISDSGRISGWAADPANPNDQFDIEFYINGDNSSGTLIGSVFANQVGFNGGVAGNHAFSYTIPDQYKDGTSYLINAYLISGNAYIRLTGTPRTFTLYAPSAAGRDYFQTTVMPRLQDRCVQCHVISHDQFFASLVSPKPSDGGTATNNEMVRMPLGAFNGKSHPGGNICGNINSSPCLEIQEWWRRQFQ